jgi:nucleoside-diphosphate-sugar epimerase
VRCLVTGSTGFIGRRLMKRLLDRFPASDIACLVKSTVKPREGEAIASYRAAGVRLIEGDLTTPFVSGERPPAVDAVFHLAANIDTAASGSALDVNDIGTEHLLAWLRESLRGARVVYTSSIAVHDRKGTSRSQPITESSPFCPRTEYGETKRRGEQILQSEAASRGYTYTVLRLATVYGPDAKPGGLIDQFAQYTATGHFAGRLNWPGRTSIIHVDDACALMIALAQNPKAANEIYCVANADAPRVGELVQHIGRLTGHPVRPLSLPGWAWEMARAAACSRIVYALTPRPMKIALWRLSLIVDHGFWFDTRKLQAVWKEPPKDLTEGLAEMLK